MGERPVSGGKENALRKEEHGAGGGGLSGRVIWEGPSADIPPTLESRG